MPIAPTITMRNQAALAKINSIERSLRKVNPPMKRWAKIVQGKSKANTRGRGHRQYWGNIGRSIVIQGYGSMRFIRAYNPAAGRMQHGGTAKPLHGEFMAVPLKRGLGGDGRGNSNLKSLRSKKNVFTIKSKRGNILIVRRNKRNHQKLITLYVLKRQVKQTAHPFMMTRGEILSYGVSEFEKALRRELSRA